MSRIFNIHDEEISARIRREQADPLVMTIVINKGTDSSVTEIAKQVIEAIRLADKPFAEGSETSSLYRQWLDGSFRKVCLKARPGQFTQLAAMNNTVQIGDTIICSPQRRSNRLPLLGKLQILQNLSSDFDYIKPEMGSFLINDDLEMSHGKVLAQLGHAALLAADVKISNIGYANASLWEDIANEFDVICTKDGGLTEVDAGSETIMSIVRKAD